MVTIGDANAAQVTFASGSGVDKLLPGGVWLANRTDSVAMPPAPAINYPRPLPWLAIAVFWLGVALLGGWLTSDAAQYGWIYAENGPVEDIEVLANLATALVFLVRALRRNDMVGAWSVVFFGAFLAAALHEFPRCSVFAEELCVPASIKSYMFAAIPVLVGVGLLIKRQDPIASLHPRWTFVFWPLGFTALYFVTAQLVEKASLVSYEEFFEFAGCMVALSLAVWVLRRT